MNDQNYTQKKEMPATITVYTMVAQRYLAPLKAAASIEIRNMPLGLRPSHGNGVGVLLVLLVLRVL